MTIPNSAGAMGNVLRLQGLKNVSGRRVMPGAEFLQDLEDPENDVAGISPPMPEINQPEADFGGELTPQSYDVRANSVSNPEQEAGFFSKLGQSLGNYMKEG